MTFYPEDVTVPVEWRTEDLWLRVLRPDVTELDYEALMESRERLRLWSDSTWPADDFTFDENWEDLEEHEREWEAREAFAYTVLNRDGSRCEGCVYIVPFDHAMRRFDFDIQFVNALNQYGFNPVSSGDMSGAGIAFVSFWVRDSALLANLDHQLLTGLREWFLAEWEFKRVFFRINDHQHDDREMFEAAGLIYRGSHSSTSSLMWHLYSEP